ncbi:MAG: hypothetical protein P8P74_09595 [Crocinitomicaceae bacterium]|nr:hypothetical protein [Crocinitomicaceae bacterium]
MTDNQNEIAIILRYEPYLIGFFVATFILRLAGIPLSSTLFVISASALALIYLMKAYDRMDHITEPWTQYMRKCIMFVGAVGIIALLFHFQEWPNADQIKLVFVVGLPLVAVGILFKKVQAKKVLNLTEAMVILGTGLAIGGTYLNLF